jgi:hypothetical protein
MGKRNSNSQERANKASAAEVVLKKNSAEDAVERKAEAVSQEAMVASLKAPEVSVADDKILKFFVNMGSAV